jgi:putative protease
MEEEGQKIGLVTHYYSKIKVGTVKLSDKVSLGDTVRFLGYTTDFEQVVDDMQYDHEFVDEGKKGQEVGIKVKDKVRDKDCMYLVKRKG